MIETPVIIRPFSVWQKLERVPNFLPKALTLPVANWVDQRPSMQHVNSEIEFMALRVIEEIGEVEEALMMGNEGDIEHAKELNDLFFFLASLAHNLGRLDELHIPSLSNHLNGLGAQDNIFDKMREVAGNLKGEQTIMRDLNWLVSAWMSYLRHGPVTADPVQTMHKVLEKNGTRFNGNHPAMYYSGRDPKTGQQLTPDEMYQQFVHARSALRTLRMANGNQPTGLRASDHLPFQSLIKDFRRSDSALAELMEYLNLPERITQHLAGYYQHASKRRVTSYHRYSRDNAHSPDEIRILIPQPGFRSSERHYH